MTALQSDARPQARASASRPSGWTRLLHARESGTLSALVVLLLIGAALAPGFLSTQNFLTVGQQIAQIGIMAVGVTFVIINAEIDLSVGSIYALGAIVTGLLISDGLPWTVAALAGVLSGAAAGFLNGALTVGLGIPSFIVTLGSLSVFRGLALLLSDGSPISLSSGTPGVAEFTLLGQGRLFGVVPMQLIFLILTVLLGWVILSRTRYGFHTYAVGGSQEAARLCGIDAGRVKILAFVMSGTLAAFAGVLGLSFLSYVQGVTGTGMELTVISAVIIGGAALFGGSGTMWGTLIGVAFIGVLQNVLNLRGISSFWQTVATGAVIILAVAVDTLLRRRTRS
ncbi:ribose transport system permease protein [Streptosporangium becharense]|uniref:Ribose transport system permease protein n=1 Tax=Streptosporangium becharense TaxID=1816182 RepID=A0A7W9IB47_9ACTN|nr:ABC transporter permease [Streptosporangium becharense]MBB2910733.1 ribose transport system permease protein [Streptosporangium becharense]MBB5817428.1 ribose transport system permease protein [Streptosporangium becharense]